MPLDWMPGEEWTLSEVQDQLDRERVRIGLPPLQKKPKPEEDLSEYVERENGLYTRSLYIGVDLGKKADHSAVVIVAPFIPRGQKDKRYAYHITNIKRYELEIPYPRIARALLSIDTQLRENSEWEYLMYVIDEGGVGAGVTDQVVELIPNADIYRATLTGGSRPNWHSSRDVSIPKPQMASTMIALLEAQRVLIPKQAFDAALLKQELLNYEAKTKSGNHDQFGAMQIGEHDDIATAMGLALWVAEDAGGGQPLQMW